MDSSADVVARRLTQLIGHTDIIVGPDSRWMPRGLPVCSGDGVWDLAPAEEAKLDRPNSILSPQESDVLGNWWLEHRTSANTPNIDLAGTCTVAGRAGVFLVEAKAHEAELRGEESGKQLAANASERSLANHRKIGKAVCEAAAGLQLATGFPWAISRDQRYQMSNRFALAHQLTTMGYAVVLVYLGFLHAEEMFDCGRPFESAADWESLVFQHCGPLFPASIWNQGWTVNGRAFLPLTRAWHQPMPC